MDTPSAAGTPRGKRAGSSHHSAPHTTDPPAYGISDDENGLVAEARGRILEERIALLHAKVGGMLLGLPSQRRGLSQTLPPCVKMLDAQHYLLFSHVKTHIIADNRLRLLSHRTCPGPKHCACCPATTCQPRAPPTLFRRS